MKYLVLCICLLGLASESLGDFVLWDDEQLTVNARHDKGTLYDQSQAHIVNGGYVQELFVYGTSTVETHDGEVDYLKTYDASSTIIGGGLVQKGLNVYDSSVVNILGGRVEAHSLVRDQGTVNVLGGRSGGHNTYNTSVINVFGGTIDVSIQSRDTSTINIFGGTIGRLTSWDTSTMNISGGIISHLSAGGGTITFTAPDFRLGPGLSLVDGELTGVGSLSGEWYDGTRWLTSITSNSNPTILLVPEPATMALLMLGGLALARRRRRI